MRVEFFNAKDSALSDKADTVIDIEGKVLSLKLKDEYAALTVKVGNEKTLVRIYDDLSSDEATEKLFNLVGRKVWLRGKIQLPKGRSNPNCFDYQRYLKGQGIYTIITVSRYKIKGEEITSPLLNFLSVIKGNFYIKLKKSMSQNYGIVYGMCFGDSGQIDEETYESFKLNGFAHILAVSGLHVNIMYMIVSAILGRKDILGDILSISLILCYTALASFSTSVIRAGIMIIIKIICKRCCVRYDSISAASLVLIFFLLLNPWKIFDSGLQLSFAAAYSMGIVLPWLEIKFSKLSDHFKSERLYSFLEYIKSSFAASLGTMPLCAYHYLQFNSLSIILNPLAIYLASYIMPAGILLFVLTFSFPNSFIFSFVSSFLDICIKVLTCISEIGEKISGDTSICAPPVGIIIFFYMFFFFFFSETRYILYQNEKYKEIICIISLFILSSVIIPKTLKLKDNYNPFDYEVAKITFLDVGQGDCIHIHDGDIDILIDGGGNYSSNTAEDTLKPYLLKNGIKDIDLAIVTHNDQDHAKGIYELEEIFEIKKILTKEEVYGEYVSSYDENDACIVSSLNIDDINFLFMADADSKRENALLLSYPTLSCDVIKIAHHGSMYSTGEDFIESINPKFAVISVGKNNYGHPSDRVLTLLSEKDIPYARTDLDGGISLIYEDDKCFVFRNAAKTKVWTIQRK